MNKKVFTAQILVEDVNLNTCSVEVFDSYEKAKEYANREIALYADDYGSEVCLTEDYPHRTTMEIQGDTYITIEIKEQEIK